MKLYIIIISITILLNVILINAQFTYDNPTLPKINGLNSEQCSADNYIYSIDFENNKISCRADVSGSVNATGNLTDTSAYVNCTTDEVFLGNGSCQSSSEYFDDTNTQKGTNYFYLYNDSSLIYFNETQMNDTIDDKTKSTIYLPSLILTTTGTVDSGNITSIRSMSDDDTYNISEVIGSPAINVYINFTDVTSFNEGIIREKYSGGSGHTIHIGVWNYNTNVWDEDWAEITDQADFVIITGTVFGATDYIGTGADVGIVQVRLNHDDSGNQNHDFYIDYVALVDGFTSTVTTNHDSLSNRDNIENHPWAMTKDSRRNFTSNIFGVGYNLTFDNYCNNSDCYNVTDFLESSASYTAGSNLTLVGTEFSLNVAQLVQYLNTLYQAFGDYLTAGSEPDLNVNSSNFWDDLDTPLTSWLSTYNATYHAKPDTDTNTMLNETTVDYYISNDGYIYSSFNLTYDAKPDAKLTENEVEAYIFDADNTANLGMNDYNVTDVECITFSSGGKICTG